MTMNPLPPQAYTKDTLLKAYHWVQDQSPAIRELATTPDLLVSLYLKASRDGDQSLDRPSIHNFKSELRSLAGMMGELERPAAGGAAPAPSTAPGREPVKTTASTELPVAPAAPQTFAAEPRVQPKTTAAIPALDAQSLEMLKEIKEQFNLSSENEALRMLIKIGYQKSRGWMRED